MIGFLTRKEELKTSKRVYIKGVDGEEIKYFLNTENFNDVVTNTPCKFTVEGDWKGIPIITSLSFDFETPEEKEQSEMITKMYGPKSVPKLKEIMLEIIDFVNNTKDPSNIGGNPRKLEFDDFKKAICDYLTDEVIEEKNGEPVKVTRGRLADFLKCTASTHHHDSQEGGLLRHIAKMIGICTNMFKAKFQCYEVHPLTIMIGILVHDIGKIDQYEVVDGEFKYVENSFYKGNHIGMGLERWARNGKKFLMDIKVIPRDIETIYWDIWHMIGSHHGSVENRMGSAWSPFGHDAWTLHSIDLLESRQEESIKPTRIE